ncbi:MAG: hypothetical protein IJ995_00810 [Clostridia bacterium]|nr:hypothetical protein [Clostridia bacterium]
MTYYDCVRGKLNEFFASDYYDNGENVVAYHVPKDAELALLLMDVNDPATVTVKAADSVLGGKDQVIDCLDGYFGIFLDLNTFIHRSGEYEGCVLIECGEPFRSELVVFEK